MIQRRKWRAIAYLQEAATRKRATFRRGICSPLVQRQRCNLMIEIAQRVIYIAQKEGKGAVAGIVAFSRRFPPTQTIHCDAILRNLATFQSGASVALKFLKSSLEGSTSFCSKLVQQTIAAVGSASKSTDVCPGATCVRVARARSLSQSARLQ